MSTRCDHSIDPEVAAHFRRRVHPSLSTGVDRERALKVRRIISEQLGVDYDRIYPEQRFIEDLGCD